LDLELNTMSNKEIRLPEGMDADQAVDVLREYANEDDAQIVNSDTLESLKSEVQSAKEAFAALLAEESPQSADTLARQDMDGLTEPFRDEESGEIDVDTLRQTPESGTGNNAGDDDGGFTIDSLGLEDERQLDTLNKKRKAFDSRGIDSRVDALEAEMTELAGADDFEEIKEVLD